MYSWICYYTAYDTRVFPTQQLLWLHFYLFPSSSHTEPIPMVRGRSVETEKVCSQGDHSMGISYPDLGILYSIAI